MPPVSPIQAAIAALVVAIGNSAVAFGLVDNSKAATVESAVMGVVLLGIVIANSIHHNANAKVIAAQVNPTHPVKRANSKLTP